MLGRANSGADLIVRSERAIQRSKAAVRRKMTEAKVATEIMTPERAMQLLEHNRKNRPLSDQHVHRIARQIIEDKWRFNGDTIKVSNTGDVLDGQHRLWACIEAKKPIETIVVRGIEPNAFATIDTLRKMRNGADVLALGGATRYRTQMSQALSWLLRWQRGVLTEFKAPQNRIENSDIEEAFASHPGIINAVERTMQLRGLANASVMAFLFYIFTGRNPEIADRMMATLEDPAGIGINDPFFRLRAYFTADSYRRKDSLMTIALAFKAANAANENKKVLSLSWRVQGNSPEQFPILEI